jgi:hypothetical protein
MIGSGNIASTTSGNIFIPAPTSLRATPTVSYSGNISLNGGGVQGNITSLGTVYVSAVNGFWLTAAVSGGGFTSGQGAVLFAQNASTNSVSASSEL